MRGRSVFFSPQSIIFYVIVFFLYYYGFQRAYRVSKRFLKQTNDQEYIFQSPYRTIIPSTVEGLVYDANDGQWRVFRHFIGSTTIYLLCFVTLSRIFRFFGYWPHVIFHFVVSLIFLKFNHNHYCLPVLFFTIFNYVVTVYVLRGRYRLTMIYVWTFAIGSLYFVDVYGRIFFDTLLFEIIPRHTNFVQKYFVRRVTLMHWVVMYDLFLLRMISFSLDYSSYMTTSRTQDRKKKKKKKKVWYCDIDRRTFGDEFKRSKSDYNFLVYFNFLSYSPLYISGPIMTYDCFVSYYHKPNFPSPLECLKYILRILVSFLTIDVSLHFICIFSIIKNPDFFLQLSGFDWVVLVVWNIRVIWLKYNTIWKFFRFFSMLDGFVPYEDITGCYWNWKNAPTFWKEFHASIRKWTLKYIYFPLGGSKHGTLRKYVNVLAVFIFIGYWHDLEWRLMGWAALASLVFIPELLIIMYEQRQKKPIQEIWDGGWLWVKGFYHFFLQFGMLSCLFVGFGIGIDRTKEFWRIMVTTKEGWIALGFSWYVYRFGYPIVLEFQEIQKEKERKRRQKIDEKVRQHEEELEMRKVGKID